METQNIVLHARFAPNGTVVEIGERPASLAPQDWFNFLSDKAGDVYQALAGAEACSVDAGRAERAEGGRRAGRGLGPERESHGHR